MTSEAFRWQAAMGAIVGSLIALGDADEFTSATGPTAIAERYLRGEPLPIDLSPHDAVAVGIGVAVGVTPLLTDPTTVALVDHLRARLDGNDAAPVSDDKLGRAIDWTRQRSVTEALTDQTGTAHYRVVRGAVAGLEGGIGAIPARMVASHTAEVRGGRRYLSRLTARLLGIDRIELYDPRQRRGPAEVLDGLWLSNLFGVGRFAEDHPDGLVLSLCDDEGRLDTHRDHLTFHIDDTPKADANPSLDLVIEDVLAELRAARAKGQPVLVHCRHGASRTGLILRLVLLEENGLTAEEALMEAQCLWPHTSSWNRVWKAQVEARSADHHRPKPLISQ